MVPVSPAETLAGVIALLGVAGSALALAFRLGSVAKDSEARDVAQQTAHDDLSKRHAENTREFRDKLASMEGRVSALENFRAGTDVKLDNIQQAIASLQATLNERLPRSPARKK